LETIRAIYTGKSTTYREDKSQIVLNMKERKR
jgi:hypothetical protein